MKIVSVCSGYEGLGAAVQAVIGGELAFVADIDPDASKLLAHRFPGVTNIGDIKAVDWVSLGAVDVFCGGFPCQPFSAAGRRLGTADPRHLWPYLARAISILRPPLVVLENVYGHLTLGFDVVLADLAVLGYDAEWVVVTASAAGACHRRARLFILAFPARAHAVAGVPAAVIRDGAWVEPCESLFGAVPFAGRIPPAGRMAGGRIYAVEGAPTVMAAGLLKTPTAQLAVNGGSQHPDKRKAGGHGPTLADEVEHLLPTPRPQTNGGGAAAENPPNRQGGMNLMTAVTLLPTPAARDGKGRDMPGRTAGKSFPETLLPTPRATRGGSGTETMYSLGGERTDEVRAQGEVLLPTPRATDGEKGGPNQRGSSGDLMLPSAVMQFLPTPRAQDGKHGEATDGELPRDSGKDLLHVRLARSRQPAEENSPPLLPIPSVADGAGGHKTRSGNRKGEPLLGGIGMLLPTPTSMDSHGSRNATAKRSEDKEGVNNDGWTLCDVFWTGDGPGAESRRVDPRADGIDWGAYEAAIRRWEAVTGRPAPRPTVPGKTGERLNPELPEWMMGLPAGWITEVPGLSRNAQLKLAGNGVVPQQAEIALRLLLDRSGLTTLGRAA